MKKLIILLFALITCNAVCAQSCLSEGITFKTQAQIDNFQTNYPGCTEIKGNVRIDNYIFTEKILNLNGLSVLHSIGGNLIIDYTHSLTNLNGLNNLSSIGGDLSISSGQSEITNLTGLAKLNSIGGGFYIGENKSMRALTGLENLKSVGGNFQIRDSFLDSLTGLENLTTIGGYIYFFYNNFLKSLSALDKLNSIGGEMYIVGNPMLTSLTGLENIDALSITELNIFNNEILSTCNVQNICNYLASPKGSVNIFSNAKGCNSPSDVANNCDIVLPCLPYGNYHFNNQSDIDSFAVNYPNCTELRGNVTMINIANLEGLANITSVSGNLEIYSENLINLNGLRNLSFVGGNLTIRGGSTWTGGCIYPAITGLAGLEKLIAIGGSLYLSCLKIHDFTGLGNLKSIGGDIGVYYTDIKNFTGLEKLSSIGGKFYLGYYQNEGGSIEGNNQYLTSFAGLNNLSLIGGSIEIWGQQSLTSLAGLDNLDSISGDIIIYSNPSLTILTGLDNLSSIRGSLQVCNNRELTSLTALSKLNSLGGYLDISGNSALTSLTGLENVKYIGGGLWIRANSILSSCEVQSVCNYLSAPVGYLEISNNAPGCNSPEEVRAACLGVGLESISLDNIYNFYPNPATNIISIKTNNSLQGETTICIFNMNGVLLQQEKFQSQNLIEIDVSPLAKGFYLVKIQTNKGIETKKLVVQ
jgi:hypothetical protein